MDPKVAYWTGAFLNMGAIVVLGLRGVRHARRGDIPRHRRSMLMAAFLVAGFLASYAVKLALLGREAMELWGSAAVGVLRFHETCVLAMLLAGGFALQRAWRMRRSRLVTRDPGDPPAPGPVLRGHRLAGRIAATAALLGLLSAGLVLGGMYVRTGLIDVPLLAGLE